MKCRAMSKQYIKKENNARLDRIIDAKAHEAVKSERLTRSKAFDALVLLTLHELLHKDAEWLKSFFKTFMDKFDELEDQYGIGIVTPEILKEKTGLDISEVYKEFVDEDKLGEELCPKDKVDPQDEINYLKKENAVLKKQIEAMKELNNITINI